MDAIDARNDDSEFVALLTGCQSALALYLRGLMPGDRGAEEVLQQTNAKIWQKRDDFKPGTNFRAWSLAIARFEVLNYRKQQARDARVRFSDELEQTIAAEIVEQDDDFLERHSALKDCLQELKPGSRDLLMMRYGSEETLADFASRIGRSAGSIKVTLYRLRGVLLTCIQRRLEIERGFS